jgi:hypothetical protein
MTSKHAFALNISDSLLLHWGDLEQKSEQYFYTITIIFSLGHVAAVEKTNKIQIKYTD